MPSRIECLERVNKNLELQIVRYGESNTKLRAETRQLQSEAYAAKTEARKARKARELQDARVNDQQKTITNLREEIAMFPQEYRQLRVNNTQLGQDVDDMEQKLEVALKAQNGAEERSLNAVEKARVKVTKAQNVQQLAEVERDRAEVYFTKAKRNLEDRLKNSASQIFNMKQEIAKRSRIDPRIFSQQVEQIHTLHRERDDARDALDSVNGQMEATKAAEAAAQSLVQTIRAELQSTDGPDGIGAELYIAQVELAQCKADAQRMAKAAASKTRHYKKQSEADRDELMKAQRSSERWEEEHRRQIFELELKHDGNMRTAQSEVASLEASLEALQARGNALYADWERADAEARLPRDPELKANLSRATDELQRVHNDHDSELQRVRDEHASQLKALRNKHATALQRVRGEHATELQTRETEIYRKCEAAFEEHKAEWSGKLDESDQQVRHWKSRAEAAEERVKALNQTAERVAHEQEQRQNDLTMRSQQQEAEALRQCEQRYEERLGTQQRRLEELEVELVRARDDLGDLQARVSHGNDQNMAVDPAASAQDPQSLPAPQHDVDMPQEELEEWIGGLEPVTLESLQTYEPFNQPPAADSAVPPQASPTSPPNSEAMEAAIDDWFERFPEMNLIDPLQQPLTADSEAPLQTSPTSPPPEPPLEFPEPELNQATVPDPYSVSTSATAQEAGPLAAPQHTPAPHSGASPTPASLPTGMTQRGPRKAKSKPNHYTQQRREEEAAYDAGLGSKLDYMFGNGPRPSAPPAPTQSVPLGIPGSSSFGKIASCVVLQALIFCQTSTSPFLRLLLNHSMRLETKTRSCDQFYPTRCHY